MVGPSAVPGRSKWAEEDGWGEVVTAAVLLGAIFARTKAIVDRAGAAATRTLTGTWPG
ncbi:DUF4235 domain-containing protein [Streptomyces sp. NPDC046759]|uniref:DUF4235 domain-containing protein n=1 Tax=Streptomyces sp. NPDC046759 TaxID=3155019 RepID=UPI0033D6B2FD